MPSTFPLTSVLPIVATLTLIVGCNQNASGDAAIKTTTPAGSSMAAGGDAARGRGATLVRVVYAIPASASVDVFADDLPIFDGLTYRTVTPYKEIPASRYSIRLRPAGMNRAEPLATNSERLGAGAFYTIFIVPGEDDAASLRVVMDQTVSPNADKARLRIVHASRDAGEVDLYASGRPEALFDAVDFRAVTDYLDVLPFTGSLELKPDGQPGTMLSVPGITLDAGKSYTLIVVGRVRTAPQLETLLVTDEAVPAS